MTESDATTPTDSLLGLLSELGMAADHVPDEVGRLGDAESPVSPVASARFEDRADLVPTIVDLVAEQEGCDPWTLEPRLDSVINAEALESLFVNTVTGERYGGWVTFTFHGYTVTVASTGVVSLHGGD